jgi:hypothetical protein
MSKKAINLNDLLLTGEYFAEARGAQTILVEAKTGKTITVFPGVRDHAPLIETTLPDGTIALIPDPMRERPAVSTREVIYSPLVMDLLCQKIASGMGVTNACGQEGMPSYAVLCKWRRLRPEVEQQLEQARQDRAEYLRDRAMAHAEEADEDDLDVRKFRYEAAKWGAGVDNSKYSPKAKIEATISAPTQILVQTGIIREAIEVSKPLEIGDKANAKNESKTNTSRAEDSDDGGDTSTT